ncbi:MAG: hypothetical protein ACRD90_00525 [Nitrosopumilaceae archaeon]
MNLDENVLSKLEQDSTKHEYHIYYQDKVYSLEDVTITKSPMPVNKPTTRDGVYSVSDKEYKIKGTIRDLSLIPFISNMMLGPNTEFQEIPIKTHLEIDGKNSSCTLYTYLTNAMNDSSKIVFNLLIIRIKIE